MTADYTRERALLDQILGQPEFHGIHGPTWWDHLYQRALQLLVRVLGRVLAPTDIATIGDWLADALLAVAVILSAIALYRWMRRREPPPAAPKAAVPAVVVDWTAWLQNAQAAAAGAAWRDAVHLTFWCAIAFLESRGAWRPDRTRTPREYLRLLPPSHDAAGALGEMARRFERVWYGTAAADRATFDAAIADLRKVGCPVA